MSVSIAPASNAPHESHVLPRGPRLNLGCGPVQPNGWVNVDNSHRARLASRLPLLDRLLVNLKILPPTEFGPQVTIHDLTKPLPYSDGSVSCIYAGELWEHFEYPDARHLTEECYRVLAPGGILRVCVPDGVQFWSDYLKIFQRIHDGPRSSWDSKPLHDHVAMYFDDICTRNPGFRSIGHKHKWQFDAIQLIVMFEEVGFVRVERMAFHQSRIDHVDHVERSDFLIVEGEKPTF